MALQLAGKRIQRLDLGDDMYSLWGRKLPNLETLTMHVSSENGPLDRFPKMPDSLSTLELRLNADCLAQICADLSDMRWVGLQLRILTLTCEPIRHDWQKSLHLCSVPRLANQCSQAGIIFNVHTGTVKLVDRGHLHRRLVGDCAFCEQMFSGLGLGLAVRSTGLHGDDDSDE